MSAAREAWREAMETRIKKEPEHLRIEMQEFKANIFREKDGELAAVGIFFFFFKFSKLIIKKECP